MSRFRRAVLGFMVIANLGIYTAFGLWLLVDGGLSSLTHWFSPPVAAAQPSAATVQSTTPAPAPAARHSPTPGWTPPPILAPLPTQPPTEAVPLEPVEATVAPPNPDSAADLPPSARVFGVVGHRQSLPLSCESRSAADWAAYFGVIIDELEFMNALPHSDDPDRGFVGDVEGEWGNLPPEAYGVHAGPVARLLQSYGLRAEAKRYMSWDDLRAEIAAGRPVIAWVTGHVEEGEGVVYTASDGRRTIVARFEHTVIVIGYDEETVLVLDGANTYRRPIERFLASWGALRNMAITAAP
jgi:uncharacterized protein YvpB